MKTFKQFLLEAEEKDIKLKLDKLKVQLDDAEHNLSSHKKMKRFDVKDTESSGKWSEKLQDLKDKIQIIKDNIKTTEDQLEAAKNDK